MLRLDEFTLMNIFEFLNVKEQLIVSYVCTRFYDVIVDLIWPKKFLKFRTNDNRLDILNKNEYEKFFSMMTVKIQDLTVQNTEHLAFTNYLARFTARPDYSYYLYFNYPVLRVLDLQPPTVHDSLMRMVAAKFPNLQVLKINSKHITGEYIADIRNLRELYAPDCRISVDNIQKIIDNLQFLTHLDISNNEIPPSAMKIFADSNLVFLRITEGVIDKSFTVNIKNMRNLRRLQIIYSTREEADNEHKLQFLRELGAEVKVLKVLASQMVPILSNHVMLMQKLKVLHLCVDMILDHLGPFLQLTSLVELFLYGHNHLESFIYLIENCSSLKHIYWESCYIHGLSNLSNWIFEIIDLLENGSHRRFLTIHLIEQGPNKEMFELLQDIKQNPVYVKQKAVKVQMAQDKIMDFRVDSFIEFGF